MADKKVLAQLEDFLRHCRPEVAKELTIVTPEDIGQDVLYHIAMNKQEKMGPFISKRAGASEDNTIPRIHVASNIQGCILGYGGVYDIAANDYVLDKGDKKQSGKMSVMQNYKGGFYIHTLKFHAAFKPSKKLVYDADKSGELWLVTYNPETVFYDSPTVGKLIPISVEFFPQVGDTPSSILKLAVELTDSEPIPMSETQKIEKGYWTAHYENMEKKCRLLNVSPISKEQFMIHKGVAATLLSNQPTWSKW